MPINSKRGRPPKEDSATEVIPPIRVTQEQKNLYKLAAEEAGLSLSAWFKNLADIAIKQKTTQ